MKKIRKKKVKVIVMNNENNVNKNNSKKTYNIIIILFLIITLVFFISKLGFKYFYSHDSNATVSSGITFSNNLEDITVSSIEFYIPSNIIVEKGNGYFTMEDSKHEYVVRIDIQNADFEYLLNNYSKLKGNADALYNSKAIVKNYGGKDYITVDTANYFSKTLIAFTKATEDKILIISVINKKNTYDYALLEKYTEIINSSIE